ncbi:MAG: hypothetical protein AB7K68_04510 [Bacteriovoracia bacterium]
MTNKISLALILALIAPLSGMAKTRNVASSPHHCAEDAKVVAMEALKLHTQADERATLDDKVTTMTPIRALKGKGKLDVLEVWGSVYRADYRIRVLYAQIKDSCASLGFEIIEAADPY